VGKDHCGSGPSGYKPADERNMAGTTQIGKSARKNVTDYVGKSEYEKKFGE
jgi:hypothetical protein